MSSLRSSSTSRSRPLHSRHHSATLLPQGPEALIIPDGAIGEEASDLIHEFLHTHSNPSEDTLQDDVRTEDVTAAEIEERRTRVWWKKPSEIWFLASIPVVVASSSTTIAPRIEIITQLVCQTIRPDYTADSGLFTLTMDNPGVKLCSSDAVVQAAVAKLLIIMSITAGVLSCLTTAWWGARSDRKGRISTMKICTFGLLATDITYIVVSQLFYQLPGSYWLLLFGPILDGFFGGLGSTSANMHAYIADCVEPARRSRVFSLWLGLMFVGVAIGPTIGSLIIHSTQQVISVFYFATVVHILYFIILWSFIPESLYPSQLARSFRLYRASKAEASGTHFLSPGKVFQFLAPLRIYFPTKTPANNSSKTTRNWNLSLLAVAYGFIVMMMGSYPYKLQYASLRFGWTSEELGYWMSIVGITRALFLTLVLPMVLAFFKQKQKPPIHLPERLEPPSSPTASSESETARLLPSNTSDKDKHINGPVFDLNIARVSIVFEVVAYILMSLVSSAPIFTAWTILGSFGAGASPALQSLALALYTSSGGTESGSLFGSMSVVNAVCSQLIAPTLFGLTYAATVGTFPQAIFLASAAAMMCSLLLISFVRLPKLQPAEVEEGRDIDHPRDETLLDPAAQPVPKILVTSSTPVEA